MSLVLTYPGEAVRSGDGRRDLVSLVQRRLEDRGFGPLAADGLFGARTRAAVMGFQTHRRLVIDGTVGPTTWAALFDDGGPPAPPAGLRGAVLETAVREVGVREQGPPNRGPRVDEYLRNVGLDPARGSYAWCAAFVYYCFTRAAATLVVNNPCVKTAGVMSHWNRAPAWARIPVERGQPSPDVIRPGVVFVVDHGGGKGHTGLVERITHTSLATIEGNTNSGGSREGDGVYRRFRPLSQINVGFIDYGLAQRP